MKKIEKNKPKINVPDFGNGRERRQPNLKILRSCRNYSLREFFREELKKTEIITTKEHKPELNLIRFSDSFHSILLYIEDGVQVNEDMATLANQFAYLLRSMAIQVFEVPLDCLHMFRDTNGSKCTFE